MSPEEQSLYLDLLYNRLLEHRYRYEVLHDPILEDWEYCWMERYHNELAETAGSKIMKMVGWDPNDPLALAAKERVDSGQDSHSLWEKGMKEVWDRLGKTRKEVKRDKENANKIH